MYAASQTQASVAPMGKPAARLTDMHTCPMVTPGTPPIPHVGGPIVLASFNVFTGKLPQARVGDMLTCIGPPDIIAMGSTGVFVNDMPAARLGDQTAHGGVIVVGEPTVLIGEAGGGGGGGAAGAGGAGEHGSGSWDASPDIGDTASGGQAASYDASGSMPTPVVLALAQVAQQVEALTQAAKNGTPFCEVCFQTAIGNLKRALGAAS